jgi:hypothetical protein
MEDFAEQRGVGFALTCKRLSRSEVDEIRGHNAEHDTEQIDWAGVREYAIAQLLRCYATSGKVSGSKRDEVNEFYQFT